MDAKLWTHLKQLFELALEQKPEERLAFVNSSCITDPELQKELHRLLHNHDQQGGFLDDPLPTGSPVTRKVLNAGILLAGRFRIVRLIGSGGMGDVYEAEDTRLGTLLALKTVAVSANDNPQAGVRFLDEVRQARSVTHANVCRVFDLGSHDESEDPILFFTMALLHGETLAQRIRRTGSLTPGEASMFALDMAHALEAAHRAGVVHGDFKAANVMIVSSPAGRDRAVVLDFGLARSWAGRQSTNPTALDEPITGTPAYMAPELLRGEAATPASDVYAWGVVTAQMLTGSLIGTAKSVSKLPYKWGRVVRRCLQPDPSRRYASAIAVTEALRTVSGPQQLAAVASLSLVAAVALGWTITSQSRDLPPQVSIFEFDNCSSNIQFAYLCAGTTNELIRRFSQMPEIRVIPAHVSRRELREHDSSRFSLDGVLLASGGEAKLSVSLTDNETHAVIWAAAFDRGLLEPLRIQQEIAAGAAIALREKLTTGIIDSNYRTWTPKSLARWGRQFLSTVTLSPASAPTTSNHALDLYMRARDLIQHDTPDEIQAGIDLLLSATREDPNFALAYAQLARGYIGFAGYAYNQTPRLVLLARQSAETAVRLRPTLAEAHDALGLALERSWQWDKVEKSYLEALRLKESLASARRRYARLLLLTNRPQEAVVQVRIASEQDPFDASAPTQIGLTLFMAGELEQARQVLVVAAARPDNLNAMHNLGDVYAALAGKAGGAVRREYLRHALLLADQVEQNERLIHADPRIQTPWADKMHAHFFSIAGDNHSAQPYLSRMMIEMEKGTTSPANVAMVLVAQGRNKEALDLLEKCVATHDPYLPLVKVMPFFSNLRRDTRFIELIHRIGLS